MKFQIQSSCDLFPRSSLLFAAFFLAKFRPHKASPDIVCWKVFTDTCERVSPVSNVSLSSEPIKV